MFFINFFQSKKTKTKFFWTFLLLQLIKKIYQFLGPKNIEFFFNSNFIFLKVLYI